MDELITVQQAIRILDGTPVTPRVERLALSKAIGQRLAEDIHSDRDYPPFDKAVMDGFAVRSADTGSPTSLRIVETIPAGTTGRRELGVGEAAAIMTGAPLPAGADAVVPVEDTSRQGDRVVLNTAARSGFAIARRGSDIEAGRIVLPRGIRLGPAQAAVAGSVGASIVSVYARPRVAVLSTGDELIEIDQAPREAQIRNSNSVMMVALLTQLGCEVQNLGIVRDDPALIREALTRGLESDALFVTGGMSMGERDYVPGLLREMGLALAITKLRIKPGKPFVFAARHNPPTTKYVFGLPGNPVSAFVCMVRLAGRILSRLAGGPADPPIYQFTLTEPLPQNGSREFYQPAIQNGSTVTPLSWKGSADIYTLARANALIIRPENAPPAVSGDSVPTLILQ
jgi:molybdopterin molybdotransferase